MPMYVYQFINPDGTGGERFEILQSIHESPLSKHPDTGQPIRRVITAASISKKSVGKIEADLSDGNLDRLGFTKYVKTRSGSYEKTVGDGPSALSADDA